jgi:aspartyl-tRNA(Asn)/glutamyl-tRNA(Gln) amidotransferase subunit A
MTLKTKIKQIQTGKLTALQNVQNFAKLIATPQTKDLNIFLELNPKAIEQAKQIDKRIKEGTARKLAGLCFATKANISVKHQTISCGSKVLEDYTAPFNATIVNKLLSEDAILLGILNMDEFACGASGETSSYGPTKNPTDPTLIPGGSSSGPAAAIAANLCDFTIGSDTGGSIRNPASHCGTTGLKPTHGAVSRYGLLDLAMTFDTIGPLTKTVEDARLIHNIIKGQDNFDQTTFDTPKTLAKTKGIIGLVNVKNFATLEIAKLIEEKTLQTAKQNNWTIQKIDLPLDIALETYYIIVYTEFFSATRKFDGRRFGKKIEESAGPEVIRRIIGGSEITKAEHQGKYYREALKAKQHIKEQFEKLFQEVDAIILPTVPRTPHKIGESITTEEMYAYDVFTTPASIAGLPAISLPVGKIDNKRVGLQIIAPHFHEERLFKIAEKFQ